MKQRGETQRELARRLLGREGAGESSADESAAAAARVYAKLNQCLAPLVGSAGVRALFGRSLERTTAEFPFLATVTVENQDAARETLLVALQGQEPVAIGESAAAVFGAFLTLLSTYLGERLTAQLLRAAWPEITTTVFQETKE